MKILIDMNLSPSWVDYLSDAGFESMHWSSIGDADSSDSVIFDHARENGFIIFTHDLDFGTILAHTQAISPSVIQIRAQDILPATASRRFVAILEKYREFLEKGALVVIDESRARVRILPLKQ
ncbi:MAG: DUF5615 family PIN-like protein [Acidobacteria bacterium]|nr:DUF5615 family PIN-like protein [Acidobacteriota bacterium]